MNTTCKTCNIPIQIDEERERFDARNWVGNNEDSPKCDRTDDDPVDELQDAVREYAQTAVDERIAHGATRHALSEARREIVKLHTENNILTRDARAANVREHARDGAK